MHIEDVFTSLIAIDYLLDIDNDKLEIACKKEILDIEKCQVGNITQSEYLDLNNPDFDELINIVEFKATEFALKIGLNENYYQKVNKYWANLDTPEAISVPHTHPNSMFNCVYYVKGNETSGNIELMDPVASKNHIFQREHIRVLNNFTTSSHFFTPQAGKLIIFPSWLCHYVKPNTSSYERISIAFNTNFELIK